MRAFFLSVMLTLFTLSAVSTVAQADEAALQKTSEWSFGDSLYAAGQDVTVNTNVDGSLTIAGETVSVTNDATISKDAWIAGRQVAVEGLIGRDLTIRAQNAIINGHVKGDVTYYGMNLSLGPDAVVDGDLRYYSASKAVIDDGAKVSGTIYPHSWRDEPIGNRGMMGSDHQNHMGWDDQPREERSWMHERSRFYSVPGYQMSLAGAVFFGLLASLVVLFGPTHADSMSKAAFEAPLMAMVIGFFWLAGIPILAVMSAVTIVGLPLAGILLLLWPLGVVMGLVASIAVIARFVSARLGAAGEGALGGFAGIVIGTGIVWAFIHAPIAGGLFWLVTVCIGIGAMALSGRVQITRVDL